MIRFFLLVNKQCQTRLSRYYTEIPVPSEEREVMEAEISRRCLKRGEQQVFKILICHHALRFSIIINSPVVFFI